MSSLHHMDSPHGLESDSSTVEHALYTAHTIFAIDDLVSFSLFPLLDHDCCAKEEEDVDTCGSVSSLQSSIV